MRRSPLSVVVGSAVAAVAALSLPAAHAQYTIYTSAVSFNAALLASHQLANEQIENFNNTILNSGLSYSSTTGNAIISGGVFNDQLTPGTSTTFTFMPDVDAVGGDFDLRPGGPGLGLQFTLATTTGTVVVTQQVPNSASGGFFGLISNYHISNLQITSGTQGGSAETYNLDNLRYVTAAAATPEPGVLVTGFAMFGATGLGLVRGRRRSKQSTSA